MASTTNLRIRRSAAQLHALAGVEREIRSQDSSSRRKYLRDFTQAYRSYQSVLSPQQITTQLGTADTILVGDYHALPASQHFAASLLEDRAQPGDRPVVLGVETIFSRDQHIVDEWWRREIDEEEFRQRIRFDLDWGYDWAPFYQLLATARENAEAIYGLDCMPGKTCARSAPATGTQPTRSPRSASVIPTPSSWCCLASRISLRGTCRANSPSNWQATGCSPSCRMWMRSTGARLARLASEWKQSRCATTWSAF